VALCDSQHSLFLLFQDLTQRRVGPLGGCDFGCRILHVSCEGCGFSTLSFSTDSYQHALTAIKVVPGGRVELPTPAFSGPRSTGELPRHRGSKRFYGRNAGVSIEEWNCENSKLNRTQRAAKSRSKRQCKRFKISRERIYNILDMPIIEMLVLCSQKVGASRPIGCR
jgi:hypothetical protein